MKSLKPLSKIKKIDITISRIVDGILSGNYRSVFRGPGLEFDEVRSYTSSDDARFIDWNVSARMQEPYLKTYKEERELELFLLMDVSFSLNSGSSPVNKKDVLETICALLALSAVKNSDRVGIGFFSDRIVKWVPAAKGKKHVLRILKDVESVAFNGKGSDLALGLESVLKNMKRRGICVILSDFKTSTGSRELALLKKKHDVIAIKVTDPIDFSYPESDLMELVDPESGAGFYGRGNSKKFRRGYSDYWELQHYKWLKRMAEKGVDTLVVSTEDDPVKELIAFFSRRKRQR